MIEMALARYYRHPLAHELQLVTHRLNTAQECFARWSEVRPGRMHDAHRPHQARQHAVLTYPLERNECDRACLDTHFCGITREHPDAIAFRDHGANEDNRVALHWPKRDELVLLGDVIHGLPELASILEEGPSECREVGKRDLALRQQRMPAIHNQHKVIFEQGLDVQIRTLHALVEHGKQDVEVALVQGWQELLRGAA